MHGVNLFWNFFTRSSISDELEPENARSINSQPLINTAAMAERIASKENWRCGSDGHHAEVEAGCNFQQDSHVDPALVGEMRTLQAQNADLGTESDRWKTTSHHCQSHFHAVAAELGVVRHKLTDLEAEKDRYVALLNELRKENDAVQGGFHTLLLRCHGLHARLRYWEEGNDLMRRNYLEVKADSENGPTVNRKSAAVHVEMNFQRLALVPKEEWREAQTINSHLRDKLRLATGQVHALEEKFRLVDVYNKQRAAHGSYLTSRATPEDVVLQVDLIRESLAFFAKSLMKVLIVPGTFEKPQGVSPEQMRNLLPSVQGVNLARKTDVKFAVQKLVSDVIFEGFWGEDFLLSETYLRAFDPMESQGAYFELYGNFKALDARERRRLVRPIIMAGIAHSWHPLLHFEAAGSEPQIANAVDLNLRRSPQGQSPSEPDSPVTGGKSRSNLERFASFFYYKFEALLSALKRCGLEIRLPHESHGDLIQDFDSLVANAWLARLLALAFDQTLCRFEVRRGQVFDPTYMETVTVSNEDVSGPQAVAFMIIPGFRVGKSVVSSRVYLHHSPGGTSN